ncbi:Ig-like domain-containing protein [Kitasatospora sp. NPDC048365]|uniref:Ig-like domain-containing protein n=1 Tax=Kitasatospora sp. NPDC048365 TaxID=3364050 RepID=UPI00371E517B
MCAVTRSAAVFLATGLLAGLNSTPVAAQQSPDSWNGDRRAVLPSGFAIQLDFSPLPGVKATAAPGKLADRVGGSAVYTDGMRAGDPAETFQVAEQRPVADGSWRTLGTLQVTFSRPVRNPRLHLSGLAGLATGRTGTTGTATRLTVAGGSPGAPTLVGRTPWTGWTVAPGELAPAGDGSTDGDRDGTGTLELGGTVATVTFRVEQRSTARAGSTTPPATLRQAYTVTLDEGLGTAPAGYGNASHVISDLFLGQDASAGAARSRPGLAQTVQRPLLPGPNAPAPPPSDPGPAVQLDGGAGRRSQWANPAPPQLQPGRGEYQGADPTLKFPAEAAVGRYYRLDVPVSAGAGPATLAGWIDFDHNGRFDPLERVQAEVQPGATTAALEWNVQKGAAGGETWARLRIARSGAQLVGSGGFADSGQVLDQKINIAVATAQPEISGPVSGTVTADPRPTFRGEGAVAGATVAITEGDTTLCTTRAGSDGTWSCRPERPLAEGRHTLVAVETTKGGMVLRGEPVRLTVKTTPPNAPQLTLPEFTNDPGLLVTGLGEPGSTVSVAVTPVGGRPGTGGELCSTAVGSDGSWSCLPVENLPDGRHQLQPVAVDAAGNRTDGKPVALTVDTVAPARPTLTGPAGGETVRTARPRLTGRAEPGTTVTVTVRATGSERATLCSGVAATDGTWACTAVRDLTDGEQTLLATATDRAGNGTAGEPVTVHVSLPAIPPASPSPSPSVTPSPSASASASASVSASPSASASASASASGSGPSSASASASGSASTSGSPSASVPASGSPSASASASAAAGGSTGPSPSASPSDGPDLTVPLPPGLLPIVVPPVLLPFLPPVAVPVGSASAVPSPGTSAAAAPSPSGSDAAAASDSPAPSASAASGSAVPSAPAVAPPASPSPTSPSPAAPSPVVPSPAAPSVGSPVPGLPSTPAPPGASPSGGPAVDPLAAAASKSPVAAPASGSVSVSASPAVTASAAASASASAVASGPSSPAAGAPPGARGPGVARPADGEGADAVAGAEAAARGAGTPAAPPPGPMATTQNSSSSGWRGLACGVLLILAALGLVTRRVFGRGSGSRRR